MVLTTSTNIKGRRDTTKLETETNNNKTLPKNKRINNTPFSLKKKLLLVDWRRVDTTLVQNQMETFKYHLNIPPDTTNDPCRSSQFFFFSSEVKFLTLLGYSRRLLLIKLTKLKCIHYYCLLALGAKIAPSPFDFVIKFSFFVLSYLSFLLLIIAGLGFPAE